MSDVLHVICTRLRPGRLSVRVGDSSRHSEEIVKKSRIAPFMQLLLSLLCLDTFTCCHTIAQFANHPCNLIKSQSTDTGPISLCAHSIMPGVCRDKPLESPFLIHWHGQVWMLTPQPPSLHSDALTTTTPKRETKGICQPSPPYQDA